MGLGGTWWLRSSHQNPPALTLPPPLSFTPVQFLLAYQPAIKALLGTFLGLIAVGHLTRLFKMEQAGEDSFTNFMEVGGGGGVELRRVQLGQAGRSQQW